MSDWTNLSLEEIEAIGVPVEDAAPSPRDSGDVVLFKLCSDLGVIPFRAEDIGGVYVRFPVGGHHEIDGLGSEWFAAWLTDKYYIAQGVSPKKTDLEGAARLLHSVAFKTPKRKTFVRLARVNGKIYLDLADEAYRVVEIDEVGWRVVENSPAWFMRPSSMKVLPLPQEGGSLDLLRKFTHLSDDDFVMVISWLVASMNPDGPFPILALSSEHGSGKSTLTTLLQRILDPNTTERLAPPKSSDDLYSVAISRRLLPYDNLSKVGDTLSDDLCRVATGTGNGKRKLFSDGDTFSVAVRRPIIVNGIALSLDRPDLLSRSYTVTLATIPEGKRRTEDRLYVAFEAAHPKILGALLTAVSAALREKDYEPLNLPRMADAASFILQAEKGGGLPWPVGTFFEVSQRKEDEKNDAAILDDPVALKVLNLSEGRGWEGRMQELLHEISAAASIEERRFLPATPKALGIKLERVKPLLRSKGVQYEKKRVVGGYWLTIYRATREKSALGFVDAAC